MNILILSADKILQRIQPAVFFSWRILGAQKFGGEFGLGF